MNQELVEGFKRYYVIEFLAKKLTLLVPIRQVDDLGLRQVMTESKVGQVFETLQKKPKSLPDDYKERRKKIEELLQSGRPLKIAQAVRDLSWRAQNGALSAVDNRMLSKGKDLLISEISVVMDNQAVEARQEIDKALTARVD